MIHIHTKKPFIKQALADALTDIASTPDNQDFNPDIFIVYADQTAADDFFAKHPNAKTILVGATHKKAYANLQAPCALADLKKSIHDLIAATTQTPDFENDTFIFTCRFRQIKNKITGQIIPLSEKESDLILFLAEQNGTLVSKETLQKEVWNYNEDIQTHTVETHVYNLRQKLGADAALLFQNTGEGYGLIFKN
ncbi:MAG: helix-turn-helix domain-containing protein [Lactobacillales bacterium]|nr:helix-turn-helix domain-containing protein [Lactobacillales bacterium]